MGRLSLVWQKSFQDDDKIRRSEGHDTIALSAFMLTSLPTAVARKALVKEMWESGAHVMVILLLLKGYLILTIPEGPY